MAPKWLHQVQQLLQLSCTQGAQLQVGGVRAVHVCVLVEWATPQLFQQLVCV